MGNTITDEFLFRFLNRETSQAENEEILQWVSSSEKNRAEFKKVHKLFTESQNTTTKFTDIDLAWNRLSNKIIVPKQKHKAIHQTSFWKVAASVAIIVSIALGTILLTQKTAINQSIVQFEAPKGEKSKIVLADGTNVWLNSQTILKYNVKNSRQVSIEGEAYFEVVKDKKHPFKVITTSGMSVTVLGTRFNIRSIKGDPIIETTLEEGEIAINGTGIPANSVILRPGQQADYNISGQQVNIREVSPEIYSIWRNNVLRFDNISFQELVPRIERWYGVSVSLDPKINDTDRFTMTVKTESLTELLKMMQLTSNFSYEINGDKVTILAR